MVILVVDTKNTAFWNFHRVGRQKITSTLASAFRYLNHTLQYEVAVFGLRNVLETGHSWLSGKKAAS